MVYFVNLATGGYVEKTSLIEARATAIRSMSVAGSKPTVPIVSSNKGFIGEVVRAPKVASGYAWIPFSAEITIQPLYKNGKISGRS